MKDGKVTFFVPNAGDANVWAHIAVQIGGQTGSFFTPSNQNMALGTCDESNSNSVTFWLPAGTYSYTADNGTWTGTVTVDHGDCQLVLLQY